MKDAMGLYRFLPKAEQAKFDRIAAAGGISVAAAIAVALAKEAIDDYCPPDERVKVAALLAATFARTEASRG